MSAASKHHGANTSRSTESDMDETITIIVIAVAKACALLVWWSVLFPMISIPILASLWVGFRDGPVFGGLLAAVSGLALLAWSQLWPASFQQWVTARIRSRWRTWSIYRHRWTAICSLHGLTAKLDDQTLVPALRSVTIGSTTDVVEVGILTGQSVADWQNRSAALAETFRARRVTVRSLRPGVITITVHHGDALITPIRLPRPATDTNVDQSSVPVGVTEAGTWWRLPVRSAHPGRRRDRLRERLRSLVDNLRSGARCAGRLGAPIRRRPQRRHGIRARTETVHRVRPRQRREHPRLAAGSHDGNAKARPAAARSDTPSYPHHRRTVDRADRR